MFAATLSKKPRAMQPNASPASDDPPGEGDAQSPREGNPTAAGKDRGPNPSKGRARKFLYGTGDRPLDGYTIKRGVGHGGFGEVYFAVSDAGKEVALKLIRRNLDVELRGVRQCLNLKHANLISLYDIRTDAAGDEWVVMEYISGEALDQTLDRSPDGLPEEQALAWFRGIAAGVAYLHQSGIVHRDLKPGNLFLEGRDPTSDEATVKIGDYGLSKFISTSRRSGQTESVGTVHYMAPEIAGGRYGREIDTYALGIILYEMLTGAVPFEGESVGEVLMKHLTAEPDLSKVSEPYRSIIARALAKDPEARISSVEEMIALLPSNKSEEAAFTPEPASAAAPNAGPWTPVSRPPHTDHPTPQREPLWQGMVELTESVRSKFSQWSAPPLMKGLVVFGLVAFLIFSGLGFAIPAAILPFYIVYYIVWALFLQEPAPSVATPTSVAPNGRSNADAQTAKPNASRKRYFGWRDAVRQQLRERPLKERARLLVGSMLFSSLVAIAAAAVVAPLLSEGDPLQLGVWIATVATLGSWGVLMTGALTEARVEDRAPVRGLQVLVGVAVGLSAAAIASTLGIGLPVWSDVSMSGNDCLLNEAFDINLYQGVARDGETIVTPLRASAVYFGLLFFLVRWWRSAEYIRRTRVGFWSIAGVAIAAWLISLVCWYPQPLGMVIAGVIALSTQAASPWLPPSKRAALARNHTVTIGA